MPREHKPKQKQTPASKLAAELIPKQITQNIESAIEKQERNASQTKIELAKNYTLSRAVAIGAAVVIAVGCILAILGKAQEGSVPVVAGIITEAANSLFFLRERWLKLSLQQDRTLVDSLENLRWTIDYAETLSTVADRDKLKMEIIRKVVGLSQAGNKLDVPG